MSKLIQVRLNDKQEEILNQLQNRVGYGISDLVRHLLVEEAERKEIIDDD